MLQPQYANYNFNLSLGFWTTFFPFLLHQLHWRYIGFPDAGRSATRSCLRWMPPLVQIMVKNTCGHRRLQLGMAAIEKLRAGKARIAERPAS